MKADTGFGQFGSTARAPRIVGRAGLATLVFIVASSLGAYAQPAREPAALALGGDIRGVHDPSVIESGSRYFLFSTGRGIPIRCSGNLLDWKGCGRVFDVMPRRAAEAVPGADTIWAPDISYFAGEYHLYFAVSTFGSNDSVIGLATAPRLRANGDTAWTDRGIVIRSSSSDYWNAIDPNIVVAAGGQPWLAFGSFWGGIKLVRIDPATGKPYADHPNIRDIARRREPPDAIEAPFIIHRRGYYYLFASYDFCCRGAASTYNIRVGRSREVAGPYLDRKGVPMLDGGGTMIAAGHGRWRGPGGESVLRDASGGLWLVYHAYDGDLGGIPTLRIAPLRFDHAGWPEPVTQLPSGPS